MMARRNNSGGIGAGRILGLSLLALIVYAAIKAIIDKDMGPVLSLLDMFSESSDK